MNNSFNKDSKAHRFFYRDLALDLQDVSKKLKDEYAKIENGTLQGVSPVEDKDPFAYSKSYSTQKYKEYNLLQMYYPFAHEIYSTIQSMLLEACEYYGVDYNSEQWVAQSWFNIHSKTKGGRLGWHDHQQGLDDVPAFHGYFCVNAEPSDTLYMIDGSVVPNKNKNNRAILSAVGYPHAVAPWEWDEERITIAYDVIPLRTLIEEKYLAVDKQSNNMVLDQHYVPLPRI